MISRSNRVPGLAEEAREVAAEELLDAGLLVAALEEEAGEGGEAARGVQVRQEGVDVLLLAGRRDAEPPPVLDVLAVVLLELGGELDGGGAAVRAEPYVVLAADVDRVLEVGDQVVRASAVPCARRKGMK